MSELATWDALATALEAGREVALAVVVGSRGSSPGHAGALMAVGADGLIAGTVGGGVAEAGVLARLVSCLAAGDLTPGEVQLTHRPGSATASGLICGGEQWVAWAPVAAGQLEDVRAVAAAVAAGERIAWTIGPEGWALGQDTGAGEVTGADEVTGAGEDTGAGEAHAMVSGPSHEVWVVGGGHVGLALSRVLATLDFWVVVAEERKGLALFEDNPWAHRRVSVPFAELGRRVPPGERTYVAIVTAGAESDAVALDALWDMPLGYLGVMGSRAKLARLLAGRGEKPPRVHAPMGVPIGSHSPAEIAVSVAAELVAVRGRPSR
ncbi:MAG: XdhC family protein [Actinomycetota bacterium]